MINIIVMLVVMLKIMQIDFESKISIYWEKKLSPVRIEPRTSGFRDERSSSHAEKSAVWIKNAKPAINESCLCRSEI